MNELESHVCVAAALRRLTLRLRSSLSAPELPLLPRRLRGLLQRGPGLLLLLLLALGSNLRPQMLSHRHQTIPARWRRTRSRPSPPEPPGGGGGGGGGGRGYGSSKHITLPTASESSSGASSSELLAAGCVAAFERALVAAGMIGWRGTWWLAVTRIAHGDAVNTLSSPTQSTLRLFVRVACTMANAPHMPWFWCTRSNSPVTSARVLWLVY